MVKRIVILLVVPTIRVYICIEKLAYWKWQLFHFIATQKLSSWELKSVYVLNRCQHILYSTEALRFARRRIKKIAASNPKEIIFFSKEWKVFEQFWIGLRKVARISTWLHFRWKLYPNKTGSWIIMEWTTEWKYKRRTK